MISELSAAADALKEAEYTLVSVGNGMNLDSGLPNLIYYDIFFRDSQYGIPGQNWFVEDPARELGYFSHRSKIYKKSTPHEGYKFLASLKNCFLYTSCVEGLHSSFPSDKIFEVHGNFNYWQCTSMECTKELIWKPDLSDIEYDPETFVAKGPFPSCDMCGSLIRPNICLSNDWNFNTTRFVTQQTNYVNWLKNVGDSKLTVIEIGAGTTFPSVRENSESMITKNRAKIIRINPFDNVVQNPSIIPLKMSAKEALIGLMKLMK